MQDSTIQMQPQSTAPTKPKHRSRAVHAYVQPLKELINLLIVRRLSRSQITEWTGLNRLTVDRYTRVLHQGPSNLIYICEYKRSATVGPYTAIYTWGPGEQDVPRPAPLPKSRKCYEQRKARRARTIITETGVIHRAE